MVAVVVCAAVASAEHYQISQVKLLTNSGRVIAIPTGMRPNAVVPRSASLLLKPTDMVANVRHRPQLGICQSPRPRRAFACTDDRYANTALFNHES